ncbi:MAG: hypothetical protein ACKOYG_04125, partial [Ilumatobacteraceae bacterium]
SLAVTKGLPMSILVVDVGTSGLRAGVVRPDGSVDALHHVRFPPSTPSASRRSAPAPCCGMPSLANRSGQDSAGRTCAP